MPNTAKATHVGASRRSTGDRVYDIVTILFLTVILIVVAYPLYFIIISSVSKPSAVASGSVTWYPIGFTLAGYAEVFKHNDVLRSFGNSIVYTVVGTLINLAVTLPCAYSLSRDDLKGRNGITIFFMITMFVSGGMIPTYLVVQGCGFINTIWALVVPGAMSIYNMIVARTFFKSNLPNELLEAAKLDGCGNTRFFFMIALPLSSAIIAILTLYYGVGHWNAYFNALLYITESEKFPLQLVLRSILIENSVAQTTTPEAVAEMQRKRELAELMKYSLIIVSSIPVMILYPFIQKHFVKGVMIGSVKG